jgi:hypothetical protein
MLIAYIILYTIMVMSLIFLAIILYAFFIETIVNILQN